MEEMQGMSYKQAARIEMLLQLQVLQSRKILTALGFVQVLMAPDELRAEVVRKRLIRNEEHNKLVADLLVELFHLADLEPKAPGGRLAEIQKANDRVHRLMRQQVSKERDEFKP